ncbi:tRNA (adenosine(37)-N6)-threonylcarbamoyltransferase complex dimerization subunit type 1 TsaB [Jannaschia seohaensis]|uniref:tRNA threonylcarbamoyl adenosine modification protein YeaZ n=1 Tax=Jannaschia seohaensis TaxID=475081 RepID=A0A2Y9A888_9RHOB|nr:tRNA (adenosine(37)-N6)-threonylcarbamoyltransferase complex dimerization subunit type 1 TsaB [Jannaschia seohaensis]PWJ22119.1 tRNA threonylcarbamoyl adenosine modification protein YeaZ [Jannaschia seohaensis]SSA38397.1 tRNA threonylcarbamoyl adenosine modification protein YeaZ [Jannaschia seohaensis]
MRVLGFDTSAAHCAAALLSGDEIVVSRIETMAKGQAERLMPLLEELLAEAGLGWADLDAIGVGTGPGNFTGTRIAVAAARGLALGLGLQAEGIGAVEAYAQGRAVTVCLPAPRGAVHVGWGDAVVTLSEHEAPPPHWPADLTGPAAEALAARLGRPHRPTPDLAEGIARIAAARAAPGRPRPAPIYLRPADAAPASDPPPRLI